MDYETQMTGLMVKYALREYLTAEEKCILRNWRNTSPEHMKIAEQFGDEKWVRNAVQKPENSPEKEMWEEITRYIDEMDAQVMEVKDVRKGLVSIKK